MAKIMKFLTKKKNYSYKEKVTIAVLLVIIAGANTVTIVKAATSLNPSVTSNLISQDPNKLVGCQAQPGFKCGEKNGEKVELGFFPDLKAISRSIGVWDYWVDTLLTQQIGSAPCLLGRPVVESFSNILYSRLKDCWTIKYRCVSFCEPPDSGGKNSIPCSVTLCKSYSLQDSAE